MLELLGLIGGALFGAACVPMAWKAYRAGNADGIPTSAIWLFTGACLTYFGYLFLEFGFHLPFLIGIVETVCWLTVMRYRYFPRRGEHLPAVEQVIACPHGHKDWDDCPVCCH